MKSVRRGDRGNSNKESFSVVLKWFECISASLLEGRRDLPQNIIRKIQILLFICGIGYLFAAIYYYIQAVYLVRGYPYNTFLDVPFDRFTDYDNMILMCRNLNPYNDHSKSGYPPFANLFYYPLSWLPIKIGFGVFVSIPLLAIFITVVRFLKGVAYFYRVSTALLLTISYPILFAFDRGNLDLWILLVVMIFLLNFDSARPFQRDLACLALAIAIAFKIYPLPLLLVFLKDKRYLDCFKTLVLALALTVASASAFQGGALNAFIDFRRMMAVTDAYTKESIQHANFNAGLFYAGVILLTKFQLNKTLAFFVSNYWVIAAIVLFGYSIVIAFKQLKVWECATCLIALFILTPALSNDYRLVFFLPPILLFLLDDDRGSRRSYVVAVIFALLLVPKNYWHLFPGVPPGDVTCASIVNPVLIFIVLNIILFGRRRNRFDKTASSPKSHLGFVDTKTIGQN